MHVRRKTEKLFLVEKIRFSKIIVRRFVCRDYYRWRHGSRKILAVAYACSLFVVSIRKIEIISWKILFTFASIIGIKKVIFANNVKFLQRDI